MICCPFHNTFEGYWMKRGKVLEPKVRDWYYDKMNATHTNFKVREAGLFIPPNHPFIGASPDGFVRCDCHGNGLLEIKCPKYPNPDDDFVLPKYYYQLQTQLSCRSDRFPL
ncbi:hypothetical protein FOCC_FOCC012674 [Frankliniella occidentalis]|nr:hypothetical protein FOCC_FOCC012674 [Frankliniella occidentalis]